MSTNDERPEIYGLRFLDGVYDLINCKFIEQTDDIRYNIYTKSIPISYSQSVSQENTEQFNSFMGNIFPDFNDYNNFMDAVTDCLRPTDNDKIKLYILHGKGSSGISSMIELLKVTLGDLCKYQSHLKLGDMKLYPHCNVHANNSIKLKIAHEYDFNRFKYKSHFMREYEYSKHIWNISERTELNKRILNSSGVFIPTNTVIPLEIVGDERIKIIEFRTRFVDEPTEPYEIRLVADMYPSCIVHCGHPMINCIINHYKGRFNPSRTIKSAHKSNE